VSCDDCTEGTYAGIGEGVGVCLPCPSGHFASGGGASECDACDAGKFALGSAAICEDCAVDFFTDSTGEA
jgi:hypothetical protein